MKTLFKLIWIFSLLINAALLVVANFFVFALTMSLIMKLSITGTTLFIETVLIKTIIQDIDK